MNYVILLAIGLLAGLVGGMFGIGGGLIVVPGLLFLVKMKDLEAIGTSLTALLPPVGLLGALEYYRNGFINIKYSAFIAAGMFVGALFGARIMIGLSPGMVKRVYAVFLIVVATRMLITGK